MPMKTLYKKALIIGGATILLEIIIVYFLYTSINAFYSDLTSKLAFLLVEQVKNGIAADKLDFSKITPYNRYPTRRIINRFSGKNSKILHVTLIDTSNRILVSDDPSIEGKKFPAAMELNSLQTDRATILSRAWEGNQEIVDVITPLVQDSIKQGYLQTVISVKHLESFYRNRRMIIFIASIFSFGIIILTVFLTSRIYKRNLQSIESAIEKLHQSDYQYRVKYQKSDEFAPVFSRLNELFEKTLDLNASFRQSEERIQAMMRVIHEGLLMLDMNMRIVSYNEYLLDILQIRNHSHPENQIYKIIQANPRLLEIYRRARDPLTHAVRKDLSLNLPNKSTIHIQINALSISEGENINSVIFYIKNLAVLKELEQNLHRSMKYTVISQLASSIGHEIRNPLSSLAIHTEILDNLVSQIPSGEEKQIKIKKSITILNSEIERLTKLIDQFFNLAKPQEIQLALEDINSVLKEVIELIQQQSYEKAVQIRTYFAKNLPLVNVSRDQIKQVIINIILNAFDAMPNGGKLYLATRAYDNKVGIAIKDTGMGIPQEIKGKIFELYFSTKDNGGGIGLAVSKKTVEAHEGKIYFATKAGEGTRFVIELPRA